MDPIKSATDLQNAISRLEIQQQIEGKLLKEEFHEVLGSLSPANLVLRTVKDISGSEKLKNEFINISVGLMTGFIGKKVFEKFSDVPMKKTMGTAIMFGINYLIAKNPEAVRNFGSRIFDLFRSAKNAEKERPAPETDGHKSPDPS